MNNPESLLETYQKSLTNNSPYHPSTKPHPFPPSQIGLAHGAFNEKILAALEKSHTESLDSLKSDLKDAKTLLISRDMQLRSAVESGRQLSATNAQLSANIFTLRKTITDLRETVSQITAKYDALLREGFGPVESAPLNRAAQFSDKFDQIVGGGKGNLSFAQAARPPSNADQDSSISDDETSEVDSHSSTIHSGGGKSVQWSRDLRSYVRVEGGATIAVPKFRELDDAEMSDAETPVVEAPVVEKPVVEKPVDEAPVDELLVIDLSDDETSDDETPAASGDRKRKLAGNFTLTVEELAGQKKPKKVTICCELFYELPSHLEADDEEKGLFASKGLDLQSEAKFANGAARREEMRVIAYKDRSALGRYLAKPHLAASIFHGCWMVPVDLLIEKLKTTEPGPITEAALDGLLTSARAADKPVWFAQASKNYSVVCDEKFVPDEVRSGFPKFGGQFIPRAGAGEFKVVKNVDQFLPIVGEFINWPEKQRRMAEIGCE